MHSTKIDDLAPAPKPRYPYLGIWPDQTLIVLFVAPKQGTCVYCTGAPDRIGEFGGAWTESEFSTYNGSVTIKG